MSPAQQPRLVALGDLLLDLVITPERPIERGTDVPGSLVSHAMVVTLIYGGIFFVLSAVFISRREMK